jgi:1-acyl-sn-glycerol-3-phosphate acyltransferase
MSQLPEAAPLTRFHRWVIFPFGRLISRIVMTVLGLPRIRGAYRVPKKGGVLILPNHRADVDPMLVQISCPRNIRFVAKSELFDIRVLGPILRLIGSFPIKRGEPDRGALRLAINLLKVGEAVCIFPEGQLTEDGELQPIKPGIALIIRSAQTPVICLGLKNTDKVMPYGTLTPRISSRRLEAMWGEPREFGKEVPAEEILAWVAGQLRELTDA